MNARVGLAREDIVPSRLAAALAVFGVFAQTAAWGSGGAVAAWSFAALGSLALLREGSALFVLACFLPALERFAPIPEAFREAGGLPALAAMIAVVAAEQHVRVEGERPATRGASRMLVLAVAVTLATLALRRVVAIVAPGAAALWLPFEALPCAAIAAGLARSPRVSRALRDRLREAPLWCLAAALAIGTPDAPAPFVLLAFATLGGVEALPRGASVPALALALLVRASRAHALPGDVVIVLAPLLGGMSRALGTAAFPALGARLRLLERARRRFAHHEGVHTHRVALALAEPTTRFVLDWHRPAVQLVVDRVGMLRVAPPLPAPELEAALAAAPAEVLAAAEVHPYLVGAIDVQAAQRSLAVREAGAAVLVRDAESGEIAGVLYVVEGTRAPLAAEEVRLLVALSRAVAASIGAGTEPAIAARMRA